MRRSFFRGRPFAAVLACLGFLLIGWSSLVVPALATQVERTYEQTDAGLAVFYLANAVAYALGSVLGGIATERLGRRGVLVAAAVLHGVGLLAQAGTSSWLIFVVAGIPRGLGTGAIDGGVNGLILDLFPEARGRALNAAHLFFALGALAAPLAIGLFSQAGVAWQLLAAGTGLVSLPLALGFSLAELGGRHTRAVVSHERGATHRRLASPGGLVSWSLVALALAIGCYVAAEMGVSNWLVRFLAAAPLVVADTALGFFWGGLTLGRLVSAASADRFDHLSLAVVAAVASAAALCAAVIVPIVPLSVALFAVVGFAFGPIYPLIMAIAGERFPTRAAAVSGVLSAAAVVGMIVYPPLMGIMSVSVGLPAAMLGTAALAFACGLMLIGLRYAAPAAVRREQGFPSDAVTEDGPTLGV